MADPLDEEAVKDQMIRYYTRNSVVASRSEVTVWAQKSWALDLLKDCTLRLKPLLIVSVL
jgi:hypothetical protein